MEVGVGPSHYLSRARRLGALLALVAAAAIAWFGHPAGAAPCAAYSRAHAGVCHHYQVQKRAVHRRRAHRRASHRRRAHRRAPVRRQSRASRPASPPVAAHVSPAPSRPAPTPPRPAPTPSHPAPTPANTGTVGPPTSPTGVPSTDPRLFSAGSVWNAPLAGDAPLDPRSPALSTAFSAEISREITLGWGPWISESSYSTPIYTVPVDEPKVHVTLDTGAWGDPLRQALAAGVPIPPGAKAAAGSDAHMTIYQPSTDTLWEFWHARQLADGWHADWGGAMQHVSTNPGYYSNQVWPGLAASDGWNWGGTATSLPVVAGTIRISELRAGHIDHALALDIPTPCRGVFSWPAQRTDGSSTDPSCLPEGAHLRIDPHLDLSRLVMPPITRILAVAAQRYGMIVRDQTGHATGFYAEDPTPTGTDPYNGPNGFYGGLYPWTFLTNPFPWSHVQVLRMNVCSAAPCAAP
jgi:hypothetical protein